MMNKLVGLLLLISSWPLVAEELQHYRVELILFTQAPVQGDDETWPENKHEPAVGEAQPLLLESALTPVSKDTAQMGAILYTLKRSSLYRPLLHTVWEQPGWPAEEAQAVRIEIPFDSNVPVTIFSENAAVAIAPPASIPQLPSFLSDELPKATAPAQRLSGTIKIHRARYLHADFDLVYREYIDVEVARSVTQPADGSFAPIEVVETVTELVEMPFQQKRRMRSKERHYIDHPRIGALIEITPIERDLTPDTQEQPPEAVPASS